LYMKSNRILFLSATLFALANSSVYSIGMANLTYNKSLEIAGGRVQMPTSNSVVTNNSYMVVDSSGNSIGNYIQNSTTFRADDGTMYTNVSTQMKTTGVRSGSSFAALPAGYTVIGLVQTNMHGSQTRLIGIAPSEPNNNGNHPSNDTTSSSNNSNK